MNNLEMILKDFDEKFEDWNFHHKDLVCFHDSVTEHAIKSFISSQITELLQSLIVELEGIDIKEHVCRFNDGEHNCDCYIEGLNLAQDKLRKIIK